MKKIVKLTESDLTRIVKQVIKESKKDNNIISEQATNFAAVFPSVNMLTTRDVKTQPLMGGSNHWSTEMTTEFILSNNIYNKDFYEQEF